MNYLLWMFLALGGADAERLGHQDFVVREAAQSALVRSWPLSRPAILAAMKSPDLEVRSRALEADRGGAARGGHVLRGILNRPEAKDRLAWLMKVQPSLVRWQMVDYALEDESGKRMLALWLIIAPFEDQDGLPWVPNAIHKEYWEDKELARALCDLVNDTWKSPDGERILLRCDPNVDAVKVDGYMGGLDNVRFWMRGLPDPQTLYGTWEPTRRLWASLKKAGLEAPPAPTGDEK